MVDVLTPTVHLTEPTIGGDLAPLWPTYIVNDLILTDRAINQTATVSVADTNTSLVADGTLSDQSIYAIFNITGAWTADRTITLPANAKLGRAINGTSGGHNVILSAGGTTLPVLPGGNVPFTCDGTNVLPTPGWSTLATFSPSTSLTQGIPLLTAYRRFRLTIQSLNVFSAGVFLTGQFSANSGSTYLTTGYSWVTAQSASSSPNPVTLGSTAATAIQFTPGQNASSPLFDGRYDIFPGSASSGPFITGISSAIGSTHIMNTWGGDNTTTGLNNYLLLTASAGSSFSATIILEGLA